MAIKTLYAQVAGNRARTAFYLAVYVAFIVAIGYGLAWYFQEGDILIIAGLIAIVQGVVSYYASDKIALATSSAQPLDQNQYKDVYQTVENLALTAGIPMPRLFVIPGAAINAFATGRDPKHAAIAITEGALQKLDKDELQGVLAHELSHVTNEDIRLTSMVMVMVGLIAAASGIFRNSLFWGGGGRRNNQDNGGGLLVIIAIVLSVLAPIAATLIQLAISRKREYMADENGVLLTRYPEGLIGALKKIAIDAEPVEEATQATAHMYFTNPLHVANFRNLFDTHPPIEDRIRLLEEGSGIRS
jgi:heat shock protein HtpX